MQLFALKRYHNDAIRFGLDLLDCSLHRKLTRLVPGCVVARASIIFGRGETQAPRQTDTRPSSVQHSNVSRRLRMDGVQASILSVDLYRQLGGASAPAVIDLRSPANGGR